jgi:hypothetical protein
MDGGERKRVARAVALGALFGLVLALLAKRSDPVDRD